MCCGYPESTIPLCPMEPWTPILSVHMSAIIPTEVSCHSIHVCTGRLPITLHRLQTLLLAVAAFCESMNSLEVYALLNRFINYQRYSASELTDYRDAIVLSSAPLA